MCLSSAFMNSDSLWGREGFLGGEKRLFTCIFQAVPFTGRANNDHPAGQKGKCHVFLSRDGGVEGYPGAWGAGREGDAEEGTSSDAVEQT